MRNVPIGRKEMERGWGERKEGKKGGREGREREGGCTGNLAKT